MSPVDMTYNAAGQMTNWRHGNYHEERRYTAQGQLEVVRLASGSTTRYVYAQGGSQVSGEWTSELVESIKYFNFRFVLIRIHTKQSLEPDFYLVRLYVMFTLMFMFI